MENGDKLELAWEGTEKTFNYTWTAKAENLIKLSCYIWIFLDHLQTTL